MTARRFVAVIDDEPDLAVLFSDALNSYGIKVLAFTDSTAAIDYLSNNHSKFIMVITDWRMPGMAGLELAKLVQQMDPEIRIVIISAFELEKEQLREIQKAEYLRKPVHIGQFIKAVESQMIVPEYALA